MKLGILSNPISHHNHRFPPTHRNISRLLKASRDAVETKNKDEIPDALNYLIRDRGVNILGVNGGDGTIHSVINSIIELKEEENTKGHLFDFPRFLFLNGGNYNMAARAMGTTGDPERTVEYFVSRHGRKKLRELPCRMITLLKVEPSSEKMMFGMIYGSHVICNALDLCIKFGSGYDGLLKLLTKAFIGYITKNSEWEREHRRLDTPDEPVVLDGIPYSDSAGGVASTVDLMLVKGLIKSLTVDRENEGFHAKILLTKEHGKIIRLLPKLLFELDDRDIFTIKEASELITHGDFTLDGEIYRNTGKVVVTRSSYSVFAIDQRNNR
jgi:hypothetical protein